MGHTNKVCVKLREGSQLIIKSALVRGPALSLLCRKMLFQILCLLAFMTACAMAQTDPLSICKETCMNGYRACADVCYSSCGCPNGCADTPAHSACWSSCSSACMTTETCCEDKCYGTTCRKNVPAPTNSSEVKKPNDLK
jgi:hypothetical protein